MKRTLRDLTVRPARIGLLALVLASCGSDGGPGGPSGNAPVLSGGQILELSSSGAGGKAEWMILVSVDDRNNDVAGGRVEVSVAATGETVSLGIGEVSIPATTEIASSVQLKEAPSTNAGLSAATLVGSTLRGIFFMQQRPSGELNLALVVFDRADNRSNEIQLTAAAAAAPPPGEPTADEPSEPSQPPGGFRR